MKYKEQKQLIKDLRDVANWLERNKKSIELPDLDFYCTNYVYEYANDGEGNKDYSKVDEFTTRLKMREIAKILGSCEKDYDGSSFSLRKKFGNITMSFQSSRAAICRKVVKEVIEHPAETIVKPARTEEVVEWICDDPLLAAR